MNKIKHFYLNKYLISPISQHKYHISYDLCHQAIWFRVYKVASRTIDHHLRSSAGPGQYIYSSAVGYLPSMYKDYFKFAFVRNPVDRFISGWKDKVVSTNYFQFSEEEHREMKNIGNFITWVKNIGLSDIDDHLKPQCMMIDLRNVDFIGRFERFKQDFAFVANRLGLDFDQELQLNSSPSLKDLEVTREDIHRIAGLYRKDIRILYPDQIEKIIRHRLPSRRLYHHP